MVNYLRQLGWIDAKKRTVAHPGQGSGEDSAQNFTRRYSEAADALVEVSSGDRVLDHAALKAIKKSKYPPLPQDFHEPYLEMRACFSYNMQSPEDSDVADKDHKT